MRDPPVLSRVEGPVLSRVEGKAVACPPCLSSEASAKEEAQAAKAEVEGSIEMSFLQKHVPAKPVPAKAGSGCRNPDKRKMSFP